MKVIPVERKTIWVSRYLSQGVFSVEAEIRGRYAEYAVSNYLRVRLTGDWFLTREEAVVDANKKREKKIRSLSNQIKRLREMRY